MTRQEFRFYLMNCKNVANSWNVKNSLKEIEEIQERHAAMEYHYELCQIARLINKSVDALDVVYLMERMLDMYLED